MIRKKHCTIELSCGCNLLCRHCYLAEERTPRGGMDAATMARILDLLAGEEFLSVAFTGDEPLLDPLLPTYVALAKERRFLTTLKTNGTLVTPENARRLVEAGLSCVHVSVYSADPREHDAVTGSAGSHAKAMNAVALFLGHRVRVRMLSPLLRPLTDLAALHALSKKFGVLWLPDPVIYASDDRRPAVENCRLDRDEMRRFYTFMLDAGLYETEKLYHAEKDIYHPCGMGDSGIVIGGDLRYRPCIRFETGVPLSERSLCDLQDETTRLKESLCERSACRDCDLRYFCQPCPALALREDGDLYGCSSTRKLVAEVARDLYLERKKKP